MTCSLYVAENDENVMLTLKQISECIYCINVYLFSKKYMRSQLTLIASNIQKNEIFKIYVINYDKLKRIEEKLWQAALSFILNNFSDKKIIMRANNWAKDNALLHFKKLMDSINADTTIDLNKSNINKSTYIEMPIDVQNMKRIKFLKIKTMPNEKSGT